MKRRAFGNRVALGLVTITLLPTGFVGASERPSARSEQGPPTEAEDRRININEAPAEELIALPGIGPSRAEAIIAERRKRRFRRVEDILRVPGIGRKTFLRIRADIRVR
jgi:competence protein ComEA